MEVSTDRSSQTTTSPTRAVDRLIATAQADANATLENTERRLQLAQEVGSIGCYEIDLRDGTTIATSGFFALYGLPTSRRTIRTDEWFSHIHKDDQGWMREHLRSMRDRIANADLEYRIVRTDGEVRWTFSRLKIDFDETGRAVYAYGIQQDITERKLAEIALSESEEHHRLFLEVNPAIFWTAEPDGTITIASNPSASRADVAGASFPPARHGPLKIHPDDLRRVSVAWSRSLATGEPHDMEYRIKAPSGEYRWFHSRAYPRRDANGGIVRWYGASEDITRRREAESQLRWLATHDALTGIRNRHSFQASLEERLASCCAGGAGVALILVDLDRFKQVNDERGHDVGDNLLREVASRLLSATRSQDVVARIGGDEFAVVANISKAGDLQRLIDRLETQLALPFATSERLNRASIGAATAPSVGRTPETLFKCADLALYEAKRRGRGQSVTYESMTLRSK